MSVAGSHDRGIWHHSGPGDSLCEAIVGKQSDFWILHYPYFVNLMMSMAIKDFTAWFFFVESPAFECFQVFCLLREGESLEQMINVLVRITVNFKRHYYLIFCWNHALQGSDFEGLEAQAFSCQSWWHQLNVIQPVWSFAIPLEFHAVTWKDVYIYHIGIIPLNYC